MAKQPTVYDVAELAGVSIATVSRYYRRPETVAERTRKAVEVAVRKLEYVPSHVASGLARGRTETLALCLSDFDLIEDLGPIPDSVGPVEVLTEDSPAARLSSDLFYSEILRGAAAEGLLRGVAVTVTLAKGRLTRESLLQVVGRVDGIIVLVGTYDDDAMAEISRRVPVVVLGDHQVDARFDQIRSDNRAGMATLTRHLLGVHGVRRTVFLAGPPDSPDSRARVEGFLDALAEAGLDVSGPVAHGDFTRLGGRLAARAILEDGPLPDAIVCANDQMALGVMDVLRIAGVVVPGDVVVTGFDGVREAAMSIPALTTVAQPMLDLGRAGVDAALSRIDDPLRDFVVRTLPVRVILRGSCGCVPLDSNESITIF